MPRNGAGVFNLPQPPFQAQTPISSSAMNSDLSDISDAITGSLPRDGQAGMTGALPLAPTGFVYTVDPNTGMHRTAADEQVITCGGVDQVKVTPTGIEIAGDISQGGGLVFPTACVLFVAVTNVPAGFLLCDGQAVSRTTFAKLFAAIGTYYGAGNGSTTFNIPDLRGRVIGGVDGGTNRLPGYTNLGATGGVPSQIILQGQLPNTALAVSVAGSVSGTLTSTSNNINVGSQIVGLNNGIFNQALPLGTNSISVSGSLSGSMTGLTSALGSGAALPNVQSTIALYGIIKT